MQVDVSLLLQIVQAALSNEQYQHAYFLLAYAIELAKKYPSYLPIFDVGIGLHYGKVREGNEDCLLALQGILPETQVSFGLFIVCDGMGGHAHGQEAAHLAIKTILEYIFPALLSANDSSNWESILTESIILANQAIFSKNQAIQQSPMNDLATREIATSQMRIMGTTITATLLLGRNGYVANVGDSRTYLYTMAQGLTRVTRDHSLVANLLAKGVLKDEEEIYTHSQRNQITRALGTGASVEVDTFVVPLQEDTILLLCSDGLWEMTRDREIANILTSPWMNAPSMAEQLVQVAYNGGGKDNIGSLVIHMRQRSDISTLVTATLDSST